ncbi:MAG: DUF4190 domain-containing protein [Lachnospiraceae bacterium]|nr:DUF4190 domain-containing protein [Lachnospiraceae bacterium]
MDYYNGHYTYRPYEKNSFATAALILGITALSMMCTGLLSIPLGALGILFAVLSRRKRKMSPPAKIGCVLSSIGLGTGIMFTLMALITMFSTMFSTLSQMDTSTMTGEEIRNQLMESLYGEDYKTQLENYGIDYDSLFQ